MSHEGGVRYAFLGRAKVPVQKIRIFEKASEATVPFCEDLLVKFKTFVANLRVLHVLAESCAKIEMSHLIPPLLIGLPCSGKDVLLRSMQLLPNELRIALGIENDFGSSWISPRESYHGIA